MSMISQAGSLTRRAFVAAGASAAGLSAPRPKKILILGGTGYLGPATVEAARRRGHQLTLFNRGKTRPGLFPGIETLHGDRDPLRGEGLRALENRRWDAVIDNSGFVPRIVSASAKLLGPNVRQYVFISSVSAYADNSREGEDETAAEATIPDPSVETVDEHTYGALKALCEKAAEINMPGRVTAVRPGFIVGPDDPSGRFTYWPVRVDRGGEVLAPGTPADPVQFIDVRDLGAWLIQLVENGTMGVFNALGPEKRLAWGNVLETCRRITPRNAMLTWAPWTWLSKNDGDVFPIWVPPQGDTRGFHLRSNRRAVRAGLRFRPYAETLRDTLAWYQSPESAGRRRLAGPTAEKEAALLAAWHADHKGS